MKSTSIIGMCKVGLMKTYHQITRYLGSARGGKLFTGTNPSVGATSVNEKIDGTSVNIEKFGVSN